MVPPARGHRARFHYKGPPTINYDIVDGSGFPTCPVNLEAKSSSRPMSPGHGSVKEMEQIFGVSYPAIKIPPQSDRDES